MINEIELSKVLSGINKRVPSYTGEEYPSVINYMDLVRKEKWQQAWNPGKRVVDQVYAVSGSIWSDAIDHSLHENGCAYIPKLPEPVYIDRPIVLSSGNRLVVHPETEIRLKVGKVGTCMVRNAHMVLSKDRPVDLCAGADQDILIEGGIWSDQSNEGRGRGGEYDQDRSMPGSMGTMIFHNVERIALRNMIFRDCSSFAAQFGNARDFLVENIVFDEVADGIHVDGPASFGLIRSLQGKTTDDIVALNAWDWESANLTFGPITDVLVEDVQMLPGYTWSEIRLLPGTKVFASGERLDCDIRRVIFRNIRGIHTFKIYDQPNIANPEEDYADPIGKMSDLFFRDIVVDGIPRSEYYDKSSDAVFDLCVDIERMSIRDVKLNYTPGEADWIPYLVSAGPKSLIWRRQPSSDSGSAWRPAVEGKAAEEELVQVFNPKAVPVVSDLTVREVWIADAGKPGSYRPAPEALYRLHQRKVS